MLRTRFLLLAVCAVPVAAPAQDARLATSGFTIAGAALGDLKTVTDLSLLRDASGQYRSDKGGRSTRTGAQLEVAYERTNGLGLFTRYAALSATMSQPQFLNMDLGNRLNYRDYRVNRILGGIRLAPMRFENPERFLFEFATGVEQFSGPLYVMSDGSTSRLTSNGPFWSGAIGYQFAPWHSFRIETAFEINRVSYGEWHVDGAARNGTRVSGGSLAVRLGARRYFN